MKRRKQKIIDKQFQLKLTFSIIGIVFTIIGLIITIIGTNFLFNNQKLIKVVEKQKEIIITQDNIVKSILLYSFNNKKEFKKDPAYNKITNDHKTSITEMDSNIVKLEKIINANNIVLICAIVLFIILIIILYFSLIASTHTISGPIQVMSKYIQEIIDGKFPIIRPLRKRDNLNKFYDLFTKMVKTLSERYNNEDKTDIKK